MNIIHLVSNKVWGGGERYVLDLCRYMSAQGHSVAVVSRGIGAVDAPFRAAGFTPGRLPLGGLFDFISPVRLARVLDRVEAPAVVHVHNFKDARTALRARRLMADGSKVRVVITRHLVRPAKTDRGHVALYNAADAMIFVSETALMAFMSTSPVVDRSRLFVVPPAVAAGAPECAESRSDGEFRIVFVGRLHPEKGIDKLLEAFVGLPDFAMLHIVGSGTPRYEEEYRRMAFTLGISGRVVWHGHVADPLPLMASAHVGVLPSVQPESFGLAVLEFMQCGVPVVASSGGGPAEIIADGTDGILVPPDDAAELHKALSRLCASPAECAAMGANAARKAAGKYSYPRFADRILEIYGRDTDVTSG